MYKSVLVLMVTFCAMNFAFAQKSKKPKQKLIQSPIQELLYTDHNYLNVIKTVQILPISEQHHIPIYTLGSADLIQVSFDDMRGDVRDYYYSIQHCNADWTPSRLTSLDYAEGFNEGRITSYQSSQGTLQRYTHYSFQFPNDDIKPKIAGNYLLKIYEDADKNRLIATKRFYVVRPLISIAEEILPSPQANQRETHQKINLSLKTALSILNPAQEIKVLIAQNNRQDVSQWSGKPNYVDNNEFRYHDLDVFNFKGHNEFRTLDLRSFKSNSAQIDHVYQDSTLHVKLFTDEDFNSNTFQHRYDENGKFYIRNLDDSHSNINAENLHVKFSLRSHFNAQNKIYIVGAFNDFQEKDSLTYNSSSNLWETSLLMKQGVYNYEYVLRTADGLKTDAISKSHFQTENEYQIFVYYRRPGTYWDELIGFKTCSIHSKQ